MDLVVKQIIDHTPVYRVYEPMLVLSY
jgi:hypothetical protein